MDRDKLQDEAPRSRSPNKFQRLADIFYGTDDGHSDGSFKEFGAFERFYRNVGSERRENVHLVSVVGGFYGLNLIPLLRPRRITFFDVNPHAITYCRLITRVLRASGSADDFLAKLKLKDYEVRSREELAIRENIALKQRAYYIPRGRGSSKRSFRNSWRYALDHFDLTKRILSEVPTETRVEGMQEASFQDYVRDRPNLWIYASNIFLFSYFDLQFSHPENVALFAAYHQDLELLDLAPLAGGPVEVRCRIPMSVVRPGSPPPNRTGRNRGGDPGGG